MPSTKIQTGLRVDEATYEKLKAIAKLESRSLNNLVEHIVIRYIADYEKVNGLILQDQVQDV